jgi:hypothetical protein
MSNYTHAHFDALTGKTTVRPFTDDEAAAHEANIAAQAAAVEAKAAARASALTKLADLGLTDDEISALVG